MTPTLQILLWLLAANLFAFVAFGRDKRAAILGARRIPERTLLAIALAGGSLGAVAGQRVFRHKTRKEPFRSCLYAIVALQTVMLAIWWARPNALQALLGG
jgi:uncharacterized membrane protein YsdA (DUF1294 family)